jgi:WD40 repeat protein
MLSPSSALVWRLSARATALLFVSALFAGQFLTFGAETKPATTISYYRQVRPILQANCQGCHQPAKSKGGYVMTDFKKLLAGGDSEGVAIDAGHPEKSALLKMITPQDGEVRMPKGKTPLSDIEVATLTDWIKQGAIDDTPADVHPHYDAEHPPTYIQSPVLSSLDFSPDGKLLAVSGFHEVLLYEPNGADWKLADRLIGLSERVQSLRFSPDGESLAVAGGDPARSGEIQIWNVGKRKLTLSAPITYDTLYGVSWSPDNKLVAFGCADNTVRAIESATGKQVLQMGSHSDWAMSTAFSTKGDHIVSGGRDMSVKLTELSSQRFIDNVTSITPGALKGGVLSVAVHPQFDHVITGGSDGLPKVYRIFREVKREIGDDAQFIANLFPMTGRVFSVRFSLDGKRIVCGSGIDRQGEIVVCSYDYTNDVPKEIRDIMGKVPGTRKPEEQKQLEEYGKKGIHQLARIAVPDSAIYSVAFSSKGELVASAGSDGNIRLFNATNGDLVTKFPSVPITVGQVAAGHPAWGVVTNQTAESELTPESLPPGTKVVGIEVAPPELKFTSPNEYSQLLVTAKLDSGDSVDATRMAKLSYEGDAGALEVSRRGIVRPKKDGKATLMFTLEGQSAKASVNVAAGGAGYRSDFVRDVAPVIAKLGCNAGTCHGAKEGKSGFKLSLRGYDPETDLRAFTEDLASRRVNVASPDDSLMLLKAIAEVPHEGGRRTTMDSKYYGIIRQWIAGGAKLDMKTPRVTGIAITPQNPVAQQTGSRQQIRVIATYADGLVRDVTAETFVESGNTDVAAIDSAGLLTALRRGEAPVLARYEGSYAATTFTVMGDRNGFVWQAPETWGKIDELVAAKWQRMKIAPSELCSDLDFLRRIYLDLTGLPPSTEEIQAFVEDKTETRAKRTAVIERLIGSPEYVDFWANKWADLLQCNSKFLGSEGADSFRTWIRKQVEENTPYDQFARSILTATGSNRENPAASYWKIVRTPAEAMENTTHLFLATRFNCNKCHDHPFERWTQDQYYHMAAYFAQVSLKEDPKSEGKKIGGTAVEGAKPLWEIVENANEGEMKHDRTGKVSPPLFPYTAKYEAHTNAARRDELASWITSPDNRYFASSYANRLWGYLTGVGIIEPLDDTRAGNPPKNPALLDYLTHEFIDSKFDARHMMKLICNSRTYQLSLRPNKWNQDDQVNYSHAVARRLPAETLFDAVYRVTGSTPQIPGAKPGQRASQLADAATDVGSGLLATLGRPARQSACECERSSDIRLGSVMALLSGPTISGAINERTNALAHLVNTEKDDRKLIDDVFIRVLNRPATDSEITNVLGLFAELEIDHAKLTNEVAGLEAKFAPAIRDLKKAREEEIVRSKAALDTYNEMTKNLKVELDKRHQAEIGLHQHNLSDYEKLLPVQAAFWETKSNPAGAKTTWTVLKDAKFQSKGTKTKLSQESDGTIVSKAPIGSCEWIITAKSSMTNITGVMIETLPDEKLPQFGPGHATDGNFVLSELTLKWGSGKAADKDAKFTDARADFSQTDYNVSQAIDGKVEAGRNGWAVAGAPGIQRHTAAFKLEHPIASTNGAMLRLTIQQQFGGPWVLGRFRIYLTGSGDPLDLGIPQTVAEAARAPAGQRTGEQSAAIIDYFRSTDTEFWKRKKALVEASQPLPADPKFTELQTALSNAEKPITLDASLVQMREDVKESGEQRQNKRLTVVQDLAWALINSPAFLFNH